MFLQIGLVDEIANDKADAIQKCENFLAQFKNVSGMARSFAKRNLRKKEIEQLENSREEDLQNVWSNVIHPDVQKQIGEYIQSLKKK